MPAIVPLSLKHPNMQPIQPYSSFPNEALESIFSVNRRDNSIQSQNQKNKKHSNFGSPNNQGHASAVSTKRIVRVKTVTATKTLSSQSSQSTTASTQSIISPEPSLTPSAPTSSSPLSTAQEIPPSSVPAATSDISTSTSIPDPSSAMETEFSSSAGMRMPLPLGSILAIIMGCLFFITLCLVIYVLRCRPPNSSRTRSMRPPTTSSFAPAEYVSRRGSFATFEFPKSDTEASRTTILTLTSPSEIITASYDESLRVSSSQRPSTRLDQVRSITGSVLSSGRQTTRSLASLNEYPFEHFDDGLPYAPSPKSDKR